MHRLPSERDDEGLSTLAARIPEKDDRENGGTVPCILQHHDGIRQSSDRPSEGLRAVPQGHHQIDGGQQGV